MKKAKALLCLLLCAALLAGCTAPQITSLPVAEPQGLEGQPPTPQPGPEPDPEPAQWTFLYQMYGQSPNLAERVLDEEGLYKLAWVGDRYLMLRLDLAGCAWEVLCFETGCAHADEACPALWENDEHMGLRSFYADGALLVLQTGGREFALYRVDTKTALREELALFGQYQFAEALAISGDWLLVGRGTHEYPDEEAGLVTSCELDYLLYNLQTGEERPVEVDGYRLLAAWDGGLLVQTNSGEMVNIEPLGGEYQALGENLYGFAYGEALLYNDADLDEGGQPIGGPTRLVRHNLRTGAEDVVLEYEGMLNIYAALDGMLLCSYNEDGRPVCVQVDLRNHTLEPFGDGSIDGYSPWRPLGSYKGQTLVETEEGLFLITPGDFWAGSLENATEIPVFLAA